MSMAELFSWWWGGGGGDTIAACAQHSRCKSKSSSKWHKAQDIGIISAKCYFVLGS